MRQQAACGNACISTCGSAPDHPISGTDHRFNGQAAGACCVEELE